MVAVGDELLAGAHPDLDSPQVARALSELGLPVEEVVVVGDDVEPIAAALERLAARHRLVVTTGGLGPTDDDVTRDAVARVVGMPLEPCEPAWQRIEAWFESRGIETPRSNRRQVLLPSGAEWLANSRGTAPGFWVEHPGGAQLVSLPGPPRELEAVLHEELVPRVQARLLGSAARERRVFSLSGLPESRFQDLLGDWMARGSEPRMGVTAREGVLTVKLSAAGPGASARLDGRAAEFRERFRAWIFAERELALEVAVIEAARARKVTLATAESLTGGGVARRLTDVPGASDVFLEGFVTYAADAKARALGVPSELLERVGPYSGEVAASMAAGAAQRSGARLAVATTGVAGPGPARWPAGGDEVPEGHVWFGLWRDGRADAVERRFPPAGRARVRAFAVQGALDLLWRALEDLPLQP